MRGFAIAGFLVAFLGSVVISAQDTQKLPEMPPPEKEHEWLQQLVGEWEVETEAYMEPGKPPDKFSGTESVRSIGGFWIVAESKGEMMGEPYTGILTLGYSPEKDKYVATWIGSMMSYLWTYEGTLDKTGKVLTVETEGPCPNAPGKLSKFKEKMEIKSPDERVFTSTMQGDDGEWVTVAVAKYRRK